jgi:hypothetical protein
MGTVLTDIKAERFVDTKFSGGKNRLCVDAEINASDITIGAVEIKDGDSDTRLDVELDSTKNAAFVQSESLAQESTLNSVLTDLDKFQFDSFGNLKVNIDTSEIVGLKNIAGSQINPATEDTLLLVKADLDQLTFDTGSLNVKVTNFPATVAVTQSTSPWVVNLITGFNLEATQLLVKADLDQFKFNVDNLKTELYTGATAYDARQIRALTTSDAVNIGQWIGSTAPTVGQKTMANSIPVTFASNQSALPISVSSGSEGTNLWQVETFNGKGFSTITADITVATATEIDIFVLKNPVSSGKLVRFQNFIMCTNKGTALVRANFRVYRAPTITSDGTALTINKIRTSQSASSVCSAFQLPTISARGTLVNKFSLSSDEFIRRFQDLGRYLEQNSNLLITFEAENAGTTLSFMAEWLEV